MIFEFEGKRLVTASDNFYVAAGAQLIGDVHLGDGASVWFNAVLRADDERIEIGDGSNVQDATRDPLRPDQPTLVGRNVTIGHRVLLHGCVIADECLIGNGAIAARWRAHRRPLSHRCRRAGDPGKGDSGRQRGDGLTRARVVRATATASWR